MSNSSIKPICPTTTTYQTHDARFTTTSFTTSGFVRLSADRYKVHFGSSRAAAKTLIFGMIPTSTGTGDFYSIFKNDSNIISPASPSNRKPIIGAPSSTNISGTPEGNCKTFFYLDTSDNTGGGLFEIRGTSVASTGTRTANSISTTHGSLGCLIIFEI